TRGKTATLLALAAVALTACGTRLPNSSFNLSQANGVPSAVQSTGPSTGPSSAAQTQGQSHTGTSAKAGTKGHTITTGQGASHNKNSSGVSTGNLFAGACGAV